MPLGHSKPSGGARHALLEVLASLPESAGKQRVVVLGDPAAIEAKCEEPERACSYAKRALEQLSRTWYATGMDRVVEAREALRRWADSEAVRRLDDRIYDWSNTLRAFVS